MTSITIRNFDGLIEKLGQIVKKSAWDLSSSDLALYFKKNGMYPVSAFPEFYSSTPPTMVLTYHWGVAVGRVAQSYLQNFPPDTTIWIDILFVNQNSLDIITDVKRTHTIYQMAPVHLVIASNEVLARCWCIFEISLRAAANKQSFLVGNGPNNPKKTVSINYQKRYFEDMQATVPADLVEISKDIVRIYGSANKFNDVIAQFLEQSTNQHLLISMLQKDGHIK